MSTQTYIEWIYAGSFVSETSVKPVNDRSEPKKWPKGACGYRFYDRTEVETADGETLYGNHKNYSPYHCRGRVVTIDEVRATKAGSILHANMENNGWNRVLECLQGSIPLRDKDIVLP